MQLLRPLLKSSQKQQKPNFTLQDSHAKPKSDYKATMEVSQSTQKNADLKTNKITADLEHLQNKHKEIFNKPSDVFKLLREVKDEPTHFFKNNREDVSLIVKRYKDNKVGKIAIEKESGKTIHAQKTQNLDNQPNNTQILPQERD